MVVGGSRAWARQDEGRVAAEGVGGAGERIQPVNVEAH
jgi:hypothetical protein